MTRRASGNASVAAGTRRGRVRARKQAAAKLVRLHLVAAVLLVFLLCLPQALSTPSRSDETALLVVGLWAMLLLRPGRAAGGAKRPPRRGRRAAMTVFWAAAGLALYWTSFLVPAGGQIRALGAEPPPSRRTVVVTSEDSLAFLARVVEVRDGLVLALDDGATLEIGSRREPAGAASLETVVLAGVFPAEASIEELDAATRLLKEKALGHIVTVMTLVAKTGPPGAAPSRTAPVEALVYPGVVDTGSRALVRSLNSLVQDIITPPEAEPDAGGEAGSP